MRARRRSTTATPDPECDLWVVQETQALPIRYALSNNIGLGGHNGAVIFGRYDGD